ncbi:MULTISPECIES: hypothetical protein [Bacillaceae]|uniref:hypothetical protein n=1 Tax=Bacillaceae TaxID=186817 RepID=UPI000BEDCA2A|nr:MULTISPECIES: hypothetical protein [unclassified Bacillus (in: firmicutes)]PEC50499.1 hypothetical protein CON00_06080 [Bacillus sp. AFS096315]PFM81968.1 hypothetical protein COJ46_07830 [Bacillus sp. AFS077874]
MLQRDLSKDIIYELSYSLFSKLSPQNTRDAELVETGLQLYRLGQVYNVSVREGRLVGVVEEGDQIHLPILHIENHDQNGCDCYEAPPCQHQIALLCYAAASFSLVGDILRKFKQSSLKSIPNIMTGRQLLDQMSMFEQDRPKETVELFEKKYKEYIEQQRTSFYQDVYFVYPLYERFYHGLLNQQPRQEKEKLLYQLLASIFTMNKMVGQIEIQSTVYDNAHLPREMTMLENQIEAVSRQLHNLTGGSVSTQYEEVLREQLQALLLERNLCIVPRYNSFRHVYKELLNSPKILYKDLETLSKVEDNYYADLGKAHLYYLLKEDETMLSIIKQYSSNERTLYCFTYWIESLRKNNETDRLTLFLPLYYEMLLHFLKNGDDEYAKTTFAKHFLTNYEYNSFYTNETAGLEVVYQALLPYSVMQYTDYLMHNREYKRWAELQMHLYSYNPDYIDKHDLQEVHKYSPQSVLPIYHHLVLYYIELKGRANYKIAVRYLKKLRTNYKKLKRMNEWDDYIQYVESQFIRLRALQEELKKGKLVNEATSKS